MARGPFSHHILLIDGANLTKKEVEAVNQVAAMFHEVGGAVLVFECINPSASMSRLTRLQRYGYAYDEIIHYDEYDPALYDRRFVDFCIKTKGSSNDVTILCGSAMALTMLLSKGIVGFMYG